MFWIGSTAITFMHFLVPYNLYLYFQTISQVIQGAEIQEQLHQLPLAKKYLTSLYDCHYSHFFQALGKLKMNEFAISFDVTFNGTYWPLSFAANIPFKHWWRKDGLNFALKYSRHTYQLLKSTGNRSHVTIERSLFTEPDHLQTNFMTQSLSLPYWRFTDRPLLGWYSFWFVALDSKCGPVITKMTT